MSHVSCNGEPEYAETGIIAFMRLDPRGRGSERWAGESRPVEEWLDLSSEEVAILDMKIQLGEGFGKLCAPEEETLSRKGRRNPSDQPGSGFEDGKGTGLPGPAHVVFACHG